MLAKKNRICGGAVIFFALALFLAGCAPAGPRALLKGEKAIERGDFAAAVSELKTATSIMATNAQAWNYYGVALQHNGQAADAVVAYQRALTLDRDLVEAHYNLGCLWLEQNKPDEAKNEFTAYTLRRGNAPEGWLKLGAAQLRANEVLSAEKSFSTALHFSPNNPEALNGLGLARVQRGRTQDAAQFFSAAVKADSSYAPAILNLATVEQKYLHDDKAALGNYQAYLALSPRPPDWDAVRAIADSLEQSTATATDANRATDQNSESTMSTPARMQTPPPVRAVAPANARANASPVPRQSQPQVVQVQPEPAIVGTPDTSVPPEEQKNSGLNRLNPLNWFRSGARSNGQPATVSTADNSSAPKPVKILPPAPPAFPRYLYLSPGKPRAGDRPAAERAFTRGREAEQDRRWSDALAAYQQAVAFDPSWFEAQYNHGVLAYRLQNYSESLAAYETALAIRPDSLDARYNFALALKAADYVTDAVNELQKILVVNPDEARAHLALGNLYAQQLNDPARARTQYLKVLALDPRNPHAADIQFWLSANPP